MRFTSKIVLLVTMVLPLCAAWAATPQAPEPAAPASPRPEGSLVVLTNGITRLNVLSNKAPMMVFVARRPWNTAHDDSIANFYIKGMYGDEPSWLMVPFTLRGSANYSFETKEGADCTLTDMRLLRTKSGQLQVIVAAREFGETYVDEMPVQFDFYRLVSHQHGETPAGPDVSFEFVGTSMSRDKYCDVNVAFNLELNLGGTGISAAK